MVCRLQFNNDSTKKELKQNSVTTGVIFTEEDIKRLEDPVKVIPTDPYPHQFREAEIKSQEYLTSLGTSRKIACLKTIPRRI